jgi:NAD(P) transhydrogenase
MRRPETTLAERFDYDLVCIGSGPAGQRAAVQAAKLRKRVLVVERRPRIGGESLGFGTIPSKTFREAVLFFKGLDRGGEFGLGALRDGASLEQLKSRVGAVLDREGRVIADQLRRNDVAIARGSASFRDPHTIAIHGEGGDRVVTAANVLVAVGTRPAAPPGIAMDGVTIVDSDQLLALPELPRSIVVIGGGVIGIEYASILAVLGLTVTVIERRERPLEFLDREIVDELMHQMRDHGVTFRLGEAVHSVQVEKAPTPHPVVALESGKRITADVAFFCIGRSGATHDLGLETTGIAVDERGRIAVDDHFRTSVPHVYAAGDVIGQPALAATSMEQGRLAACHAFGAAAGAMASHFPIGIYAIPEVSMVGATEHELTASKVPYETGLARYRDTARGQILGDDSGLFKMLFHRETRQLLGAHCIGTAATELIHIGQAVLGLGGGLDYFLTTVFNYPTLAECYKVAALNAANKLAS